MPIFVDIQCCIKFSPNETYSKRDQRRLARKTNHPEFLSTFILNLNLDLVTLNSLGYNFFSSGH